MNMTEYARGLRDLADWIDANADALADRVVSPIGQLLIYTFDAADMATFTRLLARGTKTADESYFNVTRDFGPAVSVQVYASRENVCRRVVTGTRTITETVRDPDLIEQVPLVERTREEDVVEWQCDESILRHLPEGSRA